MTAVRAPQLGRDRDRGDLAFRLWLEARPELGDDARAWLAGLGWLAPPPPCLRYAPQLRHPAGGEHPAIIAAIRGLGVGKPLIGVFRLWLQPGLEPLALGELAGGAVIVRAPAPGAPAPGAAMVIIVRLDHAIQWAARTPDFAVLAGLTAANAKLLGPSAGTSA